MTLLNGSSQEIIKQAWHGLANGVTPVDSVRAEILQSWLRCKRLGVNVYQKYATNILNRKQLEARLEQNSRLMSDSKSAIENLCRFVTGSGFIVTLSDFEGYLLSVFGDEEALNSASLGNAVPGADWSEQGAGTNSTGTALYLDKPIQIFGYEHYCICSRGWADSGAPIHDPAGKTIGAVSIGGTLDKVHHHTLGMVVATAHAIEMQLAMKAALDSVDLANQYKRTIMDSISEGLIVIDTKNYVTLVNKVSVEMLKMDERELLGTNVKAFIADKTLLGLVEKKMEVTDYETEIDTGTTRLQCTLTCRPIIKAGGCDGVVIVINEITRARKLAQKIAVAEARFTFRDIIGDNLKFRSTLDLAKAASSTDSNVLLLGESGTGKDVFAQAIHNASDRKSGPFIPINCGAIPRELIASELFGYAEGAFTGAKKGGNPGKFELADGGTIFLDEIGEMPLELQTVLLRVLEQRTFTRVGGREVLPTNVRIMAATNKDLDKEANIGNFRRDLFYRLNVFSIRMLPLRERRDDIKSLAESFLSKISNKYGKAVSKIPEEVWELLSRYPWPGNIRELQNVLERAVAVANGQQITADLLPYEIINLSSKANLPIRHHDDQGYTSHEANVLKAMLEENHWNISKVSFKLGVARSTLYRKLERYNLRKA